MSEVEFYRALGQGIRAARRRKGMSQQALADALNYESGAAVSQWESATNRPSIYTLLRIEDVLGERITDAR